MGLDRRALDLLVDCLEYPGPDTAARARRAAADLAPLHPELAGPLWDLAVFLERAPSGEPEERYTALFDMNPVCTLHVGYHLFGDTYPRGEFLAGLGAELRRAGVPVNGDLPDFLPTVLRLLGRLDDPESRRALRQGALLPALGRMGRALEPSKDPWSHLLRALPGALAEEGDAPQEPLRAAATRPCPDPR
jgi:nitrate reductase delta subunit